MIKTIIILVLLFFPSEVFCVQNNQMVMAEFDSAVLTGRIEGLSDIEMRIVMKNFDGSPYPKKFYGHDQKFPSKIIKEINISINGCKVVIPQNAIRDIADINILCGVGIRKNGDKFELLISGGDGAGGYHAVFVIKNSKIVSRTVKFINTEGNEGSLSEFYK